MINLIFHKLVIEKPDLNRTHETWLLFKFFDHPIDDNFVFNAA